ncbi:MAG: Gfo/Idh/MocA family oxidoreductase [Oscillospiraceae bacterium]|nr:Gfo/Idh/MocA family oxidoreductase [Oscillospiraceae bacterium]
MAAQKIRIGIIGCGGIANGKHMPSLAKLKNVEMVAFCDIVEEKAAKAAKQFGTADAKTYVGEVAYKKLLEDKTIDVVHVLTHNTLHCSMTCDALEAGKHVMCEKPMAVSASEAQKMVDTAKKTGKLLTIGYQNRQNAAVRFIKAEAEAGTFGEIYYAKGTAIRRRAVPTWGVFLDEEKQGGGPLIDIGTHALDLTLWTMNNYKPKYCVGTTYHKLNSQTNSGNAWGDWDPAKFTVEDSAFGFIVMENGATILLESSWALNSLDVREAVTTLCGTLGGADMVDGVRINGVKHGRQYVMQPNLRAGGVAFYEGASDDPAELEAAAWIDSVVNKKPLVVLPEEAFVVTQILEGIYKSAKTGKVFEF